MKRRIPDIGNRGIMPPEVKDMVQDFKDQTLLNPRLKNTVRHISLSFSPKGRSADDRRPDGADREKEYMQKMGITSTQYLLVRHLDQPHPHCHLVYNRVGNNGQTISDKNIKIRNAKVCRELTEKYQAISRTGKGRRTAGRLREPDKTKYGNPRCDQGSLPKCKNWNELEGKLKEQGIGIRYKYCRKYRPQTKGCCSRKRFPSSPDRRSAGLSALRNSTASSTIFNQQAQHRAHAPQEPYGGGEAITVRQFAGLFGNTGRRRRRYARRTAIR